MKILKLSLLAIAALVVTNFVQAQTADDVINKYLDAIGGRDVLGKVKSLYMENEMSVMGNTLSGTVNLLVGKGYKREMEANGQKIIQCVTDSSGWVLNPMTGSTTAQPMSKDEYNMNKDVLQIGAPLINYAANGSKVELVGKETLDSSSVYKLKLTDKDNNETDFYIDANTYYLVKTTKTLEEADMDITTTFSNYQKTDIGYVMPFATTVSMSNGVTVNTTITKVVVNQEIDPKKKKTPM
jgi:outer membrane lipoprotein-sorting protein